MSFPMLELLLAAQGKRGGKGPFAVNPGLMIWTWVVFIALFIALKRFAWPAILKSTEEREQKIAAQLAQAEKLNADAKALVEEQRRLSAEARSQAQSLLAQAKAAVEKERATALLKVRQEEQALMERTRRDIAAELDKAIAELRREAVDLALGAASKVIGQRLDSEADRRIVLEYLSKLETTH